MNNENQQQDKIKKKQEIHCHNYRELQKAEQWLEINEHFLLDIIFI